MTGRSATFRNNARAIDTGDRARAPRVVDTRRTGTCICGLPVALHFVDYTRYPGRQASTRISCDELGRRFA